MYVLRCLQRWAKIKREKKTNEMRRVGLVEGRKDRLVDFWSEVVTDGELGRQISWQPDMSGQNGRKNW